MRLGDLDALKEDVLNLKELSPTPSWIKGAILTLIDNAPTVDAVPVKHGTWVNKGVDFAHSKDDEWLYEWKCSECDKASIICANYPKADYCWMCGAKMDGERREE